MAWKHLKEQPPEWIDLPEFDEQGSRTDKEKNAELRFVKKALTTFFKLKSYFKDSSNNNDSNFSRMLKTLKQAKKIRFQIKLVDQDGKHGSTILASTSGNKLISNGLAKEINECNWADIQYLRRVEAPDNPLAQLKSAIIILTGILIEQLIGNFFRKNLTIGSALELFQLMWEEKPIPDDLLREAEIVSALILLVQSFEEYSNLSEINKLSLQDLINELDIIKEQDKIIDSLKKEKFIEENKPNTELLFQTRKILEELWLIINQAIDIGLLNQFKSSTIQGNKTDSICTKHLLLNEQKLLSRLNGDERSQRANQGKTQITNRLKQKIIELLKAHSNEKYKSINEAAEKLRLLLTPEIRQIIHDDQQSYQHNFQYSEDRYFEIIRDLIRADADLKSQYICKPLKNNK